MTDLGADSKVVRVHSTRDPFLGTVDGPSLAVLTLGSGRPETSYVGTSECLRNSKRDDLHTSDHGSAREPTFCPLKTSSRTLVRNGS